MRKLLLNITVFTTSGLAETVCNTVIGDVLPGLLNIKEIREVKFLRILTNVEEGMVAFALSVGFENENGEINLQETIETRLLVNLSGKCRLGTDFQYFPTLMEVMA